MSNYKIWRSLAGPGLQGATGDDQGGYGRAAGGGSGGFGGEHVELTELNEGTKH